MRVPRRLWSCLGGLVLAGYAFAGCQGFKDLAQEYDPRAKPEQQVYEEAIAPYLVKGAVRSGPATELLAQGLPLTAPVRVAQARRQAAAQALPPDQEQALVKAAQEDAAQGLEVALSLYIPDQEQADLDGVRPNWKVWLLIPGQEPQAPRDIRRIKNRSLLNQALYPFWGQWDRLWRLSFDARPAGQARLLLVSASGRAELQVRLE